MIKAGEIVYESEPFVAILTKENIHNHCQGCFKALGNKKSSGEDEEDSIQCQGCEKFHYCGLQCQKCDQENHERTCGLFNNDVIESDSGDVIRMLLEIILKPESYFETGEPLPSQQTQVQTRKFSDLLSHEKDFSQEMKTMKMVARLHDNVKTILQSYKVKVANNKKKKPVCPTLDEFLRLFGIVMINGFEICDNNHKTKGWAVYLAPSKLDHSCIPNAIVSFKGKTFSLRTLVDISTSNLDLHNNLFISYIDLFEHTDVRRKILKERYFFECTCQRCQGLQLHGPWKGLSPLLSQSKDVKTAEKLLYSIICQTCQKEPIFMGTEANSDYAKTGFEKCANCGNTPTNEIIEKYFSVFSEVKELLELESPEVEQNPDLLIKKMKNLFHVCHLYNVKAYEMAFDDAMSKKNLDFKKAFHFGKVCLNAYTKCGGHCLKNTGVTLYKLGLLSLELGYEDKALKYFGDCLPILELTHGRSHTMVKKVQNYILQNAPRM